MILGMSFSPLRLEIIERLRSVAFAEGMKGREEGKEEEGGQRFYGAGGTNERKREGRSGDNNDVLRDRV